MLSADLIDVVSFSKCSNKQKENKVNKVVIVEKMNNVVWRQ